MRALAWLSAGVFFIVGALLISAYVNNGIDLGFMKMNGRPDTFYMGVCLGGSILTGIGAAKWRGRMTGLLLVAGTILMTVYYVASAPSSWIYLILFELMAIATLIRGLVFLVRAR